jgi:hypothetical protein
MVVESRDKCTKFNPLNERRKADLSKSRSLKVSRDCPLSRLIGGTRSTTLKRITLRVCGWEGNHIAKDSRVEEDLGCWLPEGCVA